MNEPRPWFMSWRCAFCPLKEGESPQWFKQIYVPATWVTLTHTGKRFVMFDIVLTLSEGDRSPLLTVTTWLGWWASSLISASPSVERAASAGGWRELQRCVTFCCGCIYLPESSSHCVCVTPQGCWRSFSGCQRERERGLNAHSKVI